ncbi:MAG: hypothetical protein AABZ12_01150 [Planctomycetota bacterium]
MDMTRLTAADDAKLTGGSSAPTPSGDHPLEVAARHGIGPLSPLAKEVWHGQATPCVSCGQLAHRNATACDHCGQDLGDEMLEKMRAHAGPWYVLEHVRPFPGVSLERIILQIRRGVLTETSIVRGPSTEYQWRFAVETPGLCRFFGKCWHCQGLVSYSDTYCPACLSHLTFERPRPVAPTPASPTPTTPASTTPTPGATGGLSASAEADTLLAPSNRGIPTAPVAVAGSSVASPAAELQRLASVVLAVEKQSAPSASPDRSTSSRLVWMILGVAAIVLTFVLIAVSLRR